MLTSGAFSREHNSEHRHLRWMIVGAIGIALVLVVILIGLVRASHRMVDAAQAPIKGEAKGSVAGGFDPYALGSTEIRRVQMMLQQRGYAVGRSDGVLGPRTSDAIRRFEESRGWPETGTLSPRLLETAAGTGTPRALAGVAATLSPTAGGARR